MEQYLKNYQAKTPGSAKLFERALQVMPGGISHNPRFFEPYPLYIKSARGSKIQDVDGNEYIDLWMGHYAHISGYQPEFIVEALKKGLTNGTHWGIVNELQVQFAEDICRIVPGAEQMRFGVSGTEATMYAVRLARAYTGRPVIIKVRGGWHGASTDLLFAVRSPMDVASSSGLPPGISDYSKTISFNDSAQAIDEIRRQGANLAAVIIEAVGQYFIPPESGFLEAIQEETRKAGAVFILDEVITGFRLGLTGAQGLFGLRADLITMGKVLGGGLPLGIVAGRKDIMDLANPSRDKSKGQGVLIGGGTFSGLIPAMITGRAMLNFLEVNEAEIYPALAEKGRRVRAGIEKAFRCRNIPVKCFGVGSLFNTCFPQSDDAILKNIEDVDLKTDIAARDKRYRLSLLNHGVYTKYGGGALSLAHSDEDIEQILYAVNKVAEEWGG